jgi:hypothetical protein
MKLKRENCSRLGVAIIDYIEENQISMRELARQLDLTNNGIKSCCWHGVIPTGKTLEKFSKVLGTPSGELLRWAVEDKIKYGYRAGYADIVLQAVEEMIRVLRALVESYPEEQRPSDYQIVRQAVANLDIVGFGLRETEKKQPDRATALR